MIRREFMKLVVGTAVGGPLAIAKGPTFATGISLTPSVSSSFSTCTYEEWARQQVTPSLEELLKIINDLFIQGTRKYKRDSLGFVRHIPFDIGE